MSSAVELATLKERVTRATADLENKKKLEKERKEHKQNYEKYEAMRVLFYGNEFSTFVSAEYIKEFTVSASEQLGVLTNGKYSLSYEEESGDFFVTDFLSGNEKRKISTLSGGETFLASLSLAVAISKELSKSKSYDFFFIDEGFGTLSPDALDLVVNALTTLSKDCMVGVITHRSELIERLPRAIKVDGANGDKGSTITVV
jgi:exonuclease SbcC